MSNADLVSEGASALPAFPPSCHIKEDVGLHEAMLKNGLLAISLQYNRLPASGSAPMGCMTMTLADMCTIK